MKSDLREAAEMLRDFAGDIEHQKIPRWTHAEIVQLAERLESLPAPGEAVAWMFDYCGQRQVWLHKPSDENIGTVFKNVTPLYATAPPQVAPGFVLVPVKPTKEMIRAGQKAAGTEDLRWNDLDAESVWEDMLKAAHAARGG